MAPANDISVDSAAQSELDYTFMLKEEQSMTLKYFPRGQRVFAVLPTGFGEKSVNYCDAYRLATGWHLL